MVHSKGQSRTVQCSYEKLLTSPRACSGVFVMRRIKVQALFAQKILYMKSWLEYLTILHAMTTVQASYYNNFQSA